MKKMTIAEAKRICLERDGSLPRIGYSRDVVTREEQVEVTNYCEGPRFYRTTTKVNYTLVNAGGTFKVQKYTHPSVSPRY